MSKRVGVQLCYPFDEKRLAKWRPPYILQPKLDGERCRAIINSAGCCQLLSSEEHTIVSVPHIQQALEALHLHDVELDGELYVHGADFSLIHSIVSRRENMHPDAQYMELHLFDIVNSEPQLHRTQQLINLMPLRKTGIVYVSPIQVVQSRIVYDIDSIMSAQEEWARSGYEGFVIRDSDAPYVRRRSTQVMKFKPRKEDIYEIIGTQEEIALDGTPKGSLGAILCTGNDGTRFNVGSGSLLTQEARRNLWSQRDTLVGRYARVKYQHLTSSRGVPRFPVIVEIIDAI